MNSIYIRKNERIEKLILTYLISVIPLVLYGIYKNGILLFTNDLISFVEIFKIIIYIISPIILILVINYIKYKKIKIELNNLSWVFISIFIPVNTNILIYLIILTIFIYLDIKLINSKIDLCLVFKIILILILYFTNEYTYLNIAEQTIEYNFSIFDLLTGRTIGGIASTSLIIGMISYIMLYSNTYYKKIIPIISISIYASLTLVLSFFVNIDFTNIAGIFLSVVYLGSLMKYTPYEIKNQIIYACILGTLIIIFNFINYYESVFISLLILQISMLIYKKIKRK